MKEITKTEAIKQIKAIIAEWGSFTTAEVEAASSPVHMSSGKDRFDLVERFNSDDVDITSYVHEQSVDEYSLSYEELDADTLEDILVLCEQYKLENEEAMDTSRDEDF